VPEPSPPPVPVTPPAHAQPAPEPSSRSDTAPAPASRSENPVVDAAVDAAVRRSLAGAVPRDNAPELIVAGVPPSPHALEVLAAIARAARLDRDEMAIVTNTPRDQARFLVEQLFDPRIGPAGVRERYGMAGVLAAESYRRLRDVFQVLDLNATQKEAMVDVVETALLDAQATGQVDDPSHERIDVDPGPRADHQRFERAVAQNPSIVRCVRPNPRGDDRFYRLELPRAGAAAGGAVCGAPWTQAASNDAGGSAP
jgi:hypothetical protein